MMVAVSKVEEDKSVIISTVDPNGLVAQYGLVKGLTLHKVNDVELTGVGLKRAVETLAAATGAIRFTVFLHPSFSPYHPPRPATPYPLVESGEGIAVSAVIEDEDTNRAVRFSVPPSPASRGSLDSIPSILSSENERQRHSVESTPSRSSPARNKTRGSPSIELINNDWGSLDRSYTAERIHQSPARVEFTQSPARSDYSQSVRPDFTQSPARLPDYPALRNTRGEPVRGPIKVSHQIMNRSVDKSESCHTSRNSSPSSYQSKSRTYENIRQAPANNNSFYENIPIPFNVNKPQQPEPPREVHKPRVMGRRERAAITQDRKVQFGGFKPINAPNEHYV